MNIGIFIIGILIIVSKFLDSFTTASQITNISQETNPIVRWLMRKFGIDSVSWGILVVSIIIVFFTILIVFQKNSILYKWMFILIGILVSIFQFAVAYTNKTGKATIITKTVFNVYNMVNRHKHRH